MMKGVILAGGNGSRLYPLTQVTNKHLLPLYNEPVIFHPIRKLVDAGVDKIMIVSSPHHMDDFINLLGSGEKFLSRQNSKQIQIVYGIQNQASGIADGLWIAKDYIGNDNCVLYLGDNIVEDDLSQAIKDFSGGAKIFLKHVPDPERFGVATVDRRGQVNKIEEKPKKPTSHWAVVGVYIYDNTVFNKMVGQPKSARGEYEITYINNLYAQEGTLTAGYLKKPWFDIGTTDSLLAASQYIQRKNRNGTK